MKKIIILVFAMLSLNAFALSVNVGASYEKAVYVDSTNISDVVTKSSTGTDYDEPILAINAEVTQGFILGEIGAGASYEQGYKRGSESFDMVPAYVLLRINLFPIAIKPYINAKYGTTFYLNEKGANYEDGQFLSVGVGLTLIDTLQVEGSLNAATGKRDGDDIATASYGLSVRYNAF